MAHSPGFLIVTILYFAALAVLTWHGYRRTRTTADFLVAGRSLGPIAGGATLAVTQIGAATFVGAVGLHYVAGVSFAWVSAGAWLGWIVAAIFVAPALCRSRALTLPDHFARVFGPAARTLSAAVIVCAYVIVLIAEYRASGVVVRVAFGWPESTGVALVVAATTVYTLLGGLHGGARIAVFQSAVMVAGVLVAVPYLLGHVGGLDGLARQLAAIDPRLLGWFYGWRDIIGFAVAFGLSLAAAPLAITRFLAMRDRVAARSAVGVALVIQTIVAAAILMIGLSIRALFPDLPSGDLATPVTAAYVLMPLTGSLLIAAVFSAIMGTVNALLLVASASVVHDLYIPLRHPSAGVRGAQGVDDDRSELAANRVAIVLLAILPAWFAVHDLPLVQSIVVFASKAVASMFFAPVVIGLNWRRATGVAAVASMLAGLFVCAGWGLAAHPPLDVDPLVAGATASVLALVAVGFSSRAPGRGDHVMEVA